MKELIIYATRFTNGLVQRQIILVLQHMRPCHFPDNNNVWIWLPNYCQWWRTCNVIRETVPLFGPTEANDRSPVTRLDERPMSWLKPGSWRDGMSCRLDAKVTQGHRRNDGVRPSPAFRPCSWYRPWAVAYQRSSVFLEFSWRRLDCIQLCTCTPTDVAEVHACAGCYWSVYLTMKSSSAD